MGSSSTIWFILSCCLWPTIVVKSQSIIECTLGMWDHDQNMDEFLNRIEFDQMMDDFAQKYYDGCRFDDTETMWEQVACSCNDTIICKCDSNSTTVATPGVGQMENYTSSICNRIQEVLRDTCHNESLVADPNDTAKPVVPPSDGSNSSSEHKNILVIVIPTLIVVFIAILGVSLYRRCRRCIRKQDPASKGASPRKKSSGTDEDDTASSTSQDKEAGGHINTRILAENIDEIANAMEPDNLEILSSNESSIPNPRSPLGQPRCLDEYDEEGGWRKNSGCGACIVINASKWGSGCGNYVDELIELSATSNPYSLLDSSLPDGPTVSLPDGPTVSLPDGPSLSLVPSQEFSVIREIRKCSPES